MVNTQKNRTKDYFNAASMSELIPKLFNLLWYSTLPCSPLHRLSNDSLIKSCQFEGNSLDCSKIFQKVPTDMGMCCAFNSQNARKDSKYSKLIEGMRKSSEFSTEDKRINTEDLYVAQAGKSNGLREGLKETEIPPPNSTFFIIKK